MYYRTVISWYILYYMRYTADDNFRIIMHNLHTVTMTGGDTMITYRNNDYVLHQA